MGVQEILQEVRALSTQERKELLKQMIDLLVDEPVEKKRSLLELAGLGADIWQGIDAQEYVNQLRSEWDDR